VNSVWRGDRKPAGGKPVERLIEEIKAETRMVRNELGKDALDERVYDALRAVPRERFVPEDLEAYAYDNRPLPIGHGQTISQPFIVALMTDLLAPRPGDIMLEVGAGSGYQAAVLSRLVTRVYSMDIVGPLAEEAGHRLAALGYDNVQVRRSDGYYGWVEHAPFDGIIVTAATPTVPMPLVEQLKNGGRLVLPIGPAFGHQVLMVVTKTESGEIETREVLAVAFVPLTGDHDVSRDRHPPVH
jgi:protein-L-isoaspartate(D-aspartate) O-methyltransferase